MDSGWIKLHRKIRDHWIWQDPNYLKWWLDLIMLVNHRPIKILINGRLKVIGQGMYHTSESKLAERWFINRKTVDAFLKTLESDGMITLKKSRQDGTTLKVNNYAAYQGFMEDATDNETDNGADNESATKAQRNGHKQEVKNEKNKSLSSEPPVADTDGEQPIEKPKRKPRSKRKAVYTPDNPYYKMAEWLAKKVAARYPKHKQPDETTLQTWADSARLMYEIDKRDNDTVRKLLLFSQKDRFWQKNIRSMTKFREKYDELLVKCPDIYPEKTNSTVEISPMDTGYINLADLVRARDG